MRKHVLTGLFLATALGLGMSSGFGPAMAEDGTDSFPPEMLRVASSADTGGVAVPAPDVVTAPALVASSTLATPDAALPTSSTSRMTKTSKARMAAWRIWHNRAIRHVQHARLMSPVRPVARVFAIPAPVVRIAQTADSACPGFCGKYVLVGVGF